MIEISSFTVFVICMAGCAWHAFHLGKRIGIENTMEFLEDKGIVEFEEFPDE